MPLFGPNIKKMREKRDIEGLIEALKSNNSRIRVEATKALCELGHVQGLAEAIQNDDIEVRIEAMEALKKITDAGAIKHLIKTLTAPLQFGNDEDRIEAITLIQGRAPSKFLRARLGLGEEALKKALMKAKPQKKLDLDLVHPALLETAMDPKGSLAVRWYALTALAELGDRNDEVADLLIKSAEALMTHCKERSTESPLTAIALEDSVQEETLRALSYFAGNTEIRDALIDALQARRFVGYRRISAPWSYAMYALSAFGDSSTREHVEYWATRGNERDRQRAEVALELFGKTTFDEVQTEVKTKFGIE